MAFPSYTDATPTTRYVKTARSSSAGSSGDPDINISGHYPAAVAAANINVPSAATAAVVTFGAAGAGISHVIDGGIAYSYSAIPTGGRLTVTDDGNTVLDLDITAAGPGFVPLIVNGTANKAMVVTLASGAGSVVGKVNVVGKRLMD